MALPITLHVLAFVIVVLGGPLATPDFHHFTPTTELIKRDACQAETVCYVIPGQSIEVTNTYSFNIGVSFSRRDLSNQFYARDTIAGRDSSGEDGSILSGLKAAFNAGASYSWNELDTYIVTQVFPGGSQFNFVWVLDIHSLRYGVGYRHLCSQLRVLTMPRSCGTLTAAATGTIPSREDNMQYCNKDALTDTSNYCNTAPYYDDNGHAQGHVVFVCNNRATGEILSLSQQTPPCSDCGVSTGLPGHKMATSQAGYGPKLLP